MEIAEWLRAEEFWALCPQGEHALGPEPLSPAAQAVMDAACAGNAEGDVKGAVIAALRAAADQVVPPDPCGHDCCIETCEGIRTALLAISAELEGAG